jgi:hypothetical protein
MYSVIGSVLMEVMVTGVIISGSATSGSAVFLE